MADRTETLADVLRASRGPATLAETVTQFVPEEIKIRPLLSDELRAAIETGWEATWSLLFDRPGRPIVSVMAPHHRKAVRWHWASRHRICKSRVWESRERSSVKNEGLDQEEFEQLIEEYLAKHRPRYRAYFPIWSRGHMKSTIARRVAVVDAVISMYYGLPAYCLYFSGTDEKTNKHSASIERLLRHPRVVEHAPLLATVQKSVEGGRSLGWKATFFYTAAGCVFHFGSLQSSMAGGNVDDVRPTIIIPDDIDDRKDSAVTDEKNLNTLTNEILLMGDVNTLTFFAQNIIRRGSTMHRIHTGQARVLTDRMPSKPIPAIIGLKTELRTVNGILRDVIVAGVPTWPKYFGIPQCQDTINRSGLAAFLAECQHEVELSNENLMLHAYDDRVHVISESEFAHAFGSRDAWKKWNKWIWHDWARTKTKYHTNVAGFITVSSQSTALPGFTFIMQPSSFPPNSEPEDVMERLISYLEPRARSGQTWAELRRDTLLRANVSQHTSTVRDKVEFERKTLSEIIPRYAREVWANWNVLGGTMSHSEDKVRAIYRKVFGILLTASNPGKFDGIEDMNRAFRVDYNEPHPFRPGQMGFSRTFIVAPDDPTDPNPTVMTNEFGERLYTVYRPLPFPEDLTSDDLDDVQLMRFQLMNWRRREPKLTESGESQDELLKLYDDYGPALQMFYFKKILANVPISHEEMIEERLPAALKASTIAAMIENPPEVPQVLDGTIQARLAKMREIERDVKVKKNGLGRYRRR